jgi:hypothetical protein
MLSSVLGSERAIAVNTEIMRAFVRMRQLLSSNKELARRFADIGSLMAGFDNRRLSAGDGQPVPSGYPVE